MSIDLDQVVLDGGRRFVNFFEGRILTGRDLRDEQAASRQGRNALGRGIGAGVVHGFEVADATPSEAGAVPALRIAAGLAVTREGQTLDLKAERTLRLAVLDPDSPNQNVGAFDLCADQPPTSEAPTAEGFHILTVAPATGYEEEAPKSGLEDAGSAAGCGRRYVTLGLRFRLVRFDPALLAGDAQGAQIAALALNTGPTSVSRLRSHVAHLGLGTQARAAFPGDPFARDATGLSDFTDWGLEAQLAGLDVPALEACEVPLAVLRLRAGQIRFLDMWSVRRPPRTPAVAQHWPLQGPFARPGTDAATFFQFQDQMSWLLGTQGAPQTLNAAEYFAHLPPVGFLPFSTASNFLPDAPAPIDLNPRRLIAVVEEALAYPALRLGTTPAPRFNIYRVDPSANWVLFVSDAVPSEENQALKCAQLEARIATLETLLEAPGTVTGLVGGRLFFQGNISPIANATVTATPRGASTGEVVTVTSGSDGRFALELPAGAYRLAAIAPNQTRVGATRDIELARGEALDADLIIQFVFQAIVVDP